MTDKRAPVFISYSHNDKKAVDLIIAQLKEMGVAVWLDKDTISAGTNWRNEIEKALDEANIFLLIISPSFLKSQWANFEMGVALSRASESVETRVIPILLEGVSPEALPAPLKHIQFIDARDMDIGKLSQQLASLLPKTG